MKFLVTLFVVYAALNYVKSDDDIHFTEIANECKAEAGASDDDLAIVIKHEEAGSTEAKCLRACMMKKFGLMTDDSHLNKESAIELVKKIAKGDEEVEKFGVETVDNCAGIEVPDDHCEAAEAYSKCMKAYLDKHVE